MFCPSHRDTSCCANILVKCLVWVLLESTILKGRIEKPWFLILFRETKGRYEYCRKSTVCNTNCRLQATRYFENLALTFPEWFTQLVTSLEHRLTSDTTNKSCSVRQSTLQKRNISGLQIVRKIFFGLWILKVHSKILGERYRSELISDLSSDWKGNISRFMLLGF